MDLFGYSIDQDLMRPGRIVQLEIHRSAPLKIPPTPMVLEINMFIRHRAPPSFDKDVVKGTASSIHTDLDPSRFEPLREGRTRELAALIAIEDLRPPLVERLLQGVKAEDRVLRV